MQQLVREDVDAGLPLDRLEQHSGGVIVYRLRERVGVLGGDHEARDERRERRLL